ncbi:uncharacterized protein LOC122243734 [Penaeus japonicus]|uniref:uncharacterized protein LOC122243734 n=1 Tax=Penaeus japonicus TaxID=27405 RepID=UPI001C70C9CC|nr:uncharacterized protein LOC122243734 [Penaeus japonicus]
MSLIRSQFPGLGGLCASGAVMFLEPFPLPQPPRFIQIINRATPMSLSDMSAYHATGGSHWLTVSNIFAKEPEEVVVYDSNYSTISSSTRALLRKLYANYGDFKVRHERVQKQTDTTSCGKWAIAYAFDLALGHDPRRQRYDFGRMADHLVSAFETATVSRFPRL